jgi:exopolysaccharide biosynthesis predicted pyruvyltransferase EpsI
LIFDNYVLDKSDEKNNFIHKIAKEFKLHPIAGMPSNQFELKKSKKDLSDCVFMSIPEWIAGFRDAKFVFTDSFHGAVFSILFNKPFVVFANESRGNARLDSLLT